MIQIKCLGVTMAAALCFIAIVPLAFASDARTDGANTPAADPLQGIQNISQLAWVPVGADAQATQQWASYVGWAQAETTAETRREAAAVSALIPIRRPLDTDCYESLNCSMILALDHIRSQFSSAEDFTAARHRSWEFVYPFVRAAQIVETQLSQTPDLEMQLRLRTLREQIMRSAMGDVYSPGATSLSDRERSLALIMLRYEISIRDRDNARTLARIIHDQGWPLRTHFSAGANSSGWLIAQHADRDPAFQVEVLQLFAHAPRRTISGHDYAALYDRVHLKIDGVQRYGTQFVCNNGSWTPETLEQPDQVNALRHGLGMDPLPVLGGHCQ